ncbi:hypothetical protein LOY94_003056 [Ophidiomyces ophidiicola]|uniref:Uncharacterized protein n=1 Tax=Ophidiomyces ophidiicola TaxID=1387563 RepID=A0ACB8V1V6_9EURO|nr:hypothetical protein LOZ20_004324 [Ophidiomyces ophidiicola]KAI2265425.1 hypothetical protein LOZ10_002342 [Ophidiomyces ophidiicola]KAI2351521.1 hypothetical protein LOY94_003056 [Ophidiomyces ophidiicola]KAI2389222.1 hypothetical protein LOY88_002188 [Ophidiomyces ophidiicola]
MKNSENRSAKKIAPFAVSDDKLRDNMAMAEVEVYARLQKINIATMPLPLRKDVIQLRLAITEARNDSSDVWGPFLWICPVAWPFTVTEVQQQDVVES